MRCGEGMRIKLSKANIQKLEPGATRYEVADVESPAFRLRVTPSGVKTFVLLYRNAENKQKRFTIGKYGDLTPELARDIAQTKMAEIKLGGDPAAQKQEIRRQSERDKYSTLGGFVDLKFGPWAQANRKTGAEMALRIKNQFADYLEKPLDEITPWIIEKWRKAKFERGRKPGTINKDIATLKSCLSRAVDWGVIDHHPLARLKLSKQDRSGVVRYLSPGEEKRLRDGMKARDYKIKQERESGNKWRRDRNKPELPSLIDAAFTDHLSPMVLLSLNTGMRRGEVFNLRWSDVDFSNKSLVIHGHSSKSGRSRHVPLNAEALDTLERWRRQQKSLSELVFPGKGGQPFNNVKRSWDALLQAAKIDRFRWHDMRHHFASKLVMASVDLNTVRELLGHSDFKLTMRYAHLAPEHKAAAVAKLVDTK